MAARAVVNGRVAKVRRVAATAETVAADRDAVAAAGVESVGTASR